MAQGALPSAASTYDDRVRGRSECSEHGASAGYSLAHTAPSSTTLNDHPEASFNTNKAQEKSHFLTSERNIETFALQ